MVFDVLDRFLEAQSGLVLGVPLPFRFVLGFRCQERRLRGQVKYLVVLGGGGGVRERRRLLAVGVAAAAVVSDFAWPHLMPALPHVHHHALLGYRLDSKRPSRSTSFATASIPRLFPLPPFLSVAL